MSGFPVGMNYGSWGDDWGYAQLARYNMGNGGCDVAGWYGGTNGRVNGTGDGSGAAQASGKGFNFWKTAGYATVPAAAVGAGMYLANNQFNSPYASDSKALSETFMKNFSEDYAALQNKGNNVAKFYKDLSGKKFPVNAENYSATMESIEDFIKTKKVDNLTDEARAVLVKKFGLKGKKAAVDTALGALTETQLKDFYATTEFGHAGQLSANSLNTRLNMLNDIEGFKDAWDDLGKGKTSAAGKVEFLRKNAHTLNMSEADYKTLLAEHSDDTALNKLWEKYAKGTDKKKPYSVLEARQKSIEGEVKTIKDAMKAMVDKHYNKEAGWFGKLFKSKGKEATALENALSKMRKCKASKYAGIAAVAGAVISLIA